MSAKILITGTGGQLGSELLRSFAGAGELIALRRDVADFASPDRLRVYVRELRPDIILNPAAYTAVDKAESEAELAMRVNGDAPRVLAEEARRTEALLVHYSTDYVFDGSKQDPWTEQDTPRPLGVYGATKLAGEHAVAQAGGKHLILRTSWVYGPHGRNFLLTMLRMARERDRLTIVDDQRGAPTTSLELARATRHIVDGVLSGQFGNQDQWAGTYHMTCGGATSWCGFARAIFERAGRLQSGRIPEVIPIATADYPTPARRPLNSRLSNQKLNTTFGIQLAAWEAALDEVIGLLKLKDSALHG
ncbi:MAG TPA: dTDP-4-dehydrorhamnose reductase [Terracidiphilus sp.]|jgi:dTDP-4-dehydrorhamnose reductase|nr:dTDP-4-dehydrorhamnose reductase [Terracidiphilus sp.]